MSQIGTNDFVELNVRGEMVATGREAAERYGFDPEKCTVTVMINDNGSLVIRQTPQACFDSVSLSPRFWRPTFSNR